MGKEYGSNEEIIDVNRIKKGPHRNNNNNKEMDYVSTNEYAPTREFHDRRG